MRKGSLLDVSLGPFERGGVFVVRLDEAVDGLAYFVRGGETGPAQRSTAENTEPDLDLVEPGGVGGRVVQVHLAVAFEPAITFRFVGVEVVQYDVQLKTLVEIDQLIHEVKKLTPDAWTQYSVARSAVGEATDERWP